MSQERKGTQGAPVSFLDVIACAFGAVILLIVILPVGMFALQPEDSDESEEFGRLLFKASALEQTIASLRSELQRTRQLTTDMNAGILSSAQASQKVREAIQQAHQGIEATNSQTEALEKSADLLTSFRPTSLKATDLPIQLAGIPVDSEYVAFVVDTSPSMREFWGDVVRQVKHVLELYPQLKGFQLLNDQGRYLIKGYRGRWMRDSKSARKSALKRFRSWLAFSFSTPENGISSAVRSLYRDGIKMAIFVIGDNYSGRDFDSFLQKIDSVVKQRNVGEGALRIHAIGFYGTSHNIQDQEGARSFATLMRELTRQHRGVFLGIEVNPLVVHALEGN